MPLEIVTINDVVSRVWNNNMWWIFHSLKECQNWEICHNGSSIIVYYVTDSSDGYTNNKTIKNYIQESVMYS